MGVEFSCANRCTSERPKPMNMEPFGAVGLTPSTKQVVAASGVPTDPCQLVELYSRAVYHEHDADTAMLLTTDDFTLEKMGAVEVRSKVEAIPRWADKNKPDLETVEMSHIVRESSDDLLVVRRVKLTIMIVTITIRQEYTIRKLNGKPKISYVCLKKD